MEKEKTILGYETVTLDAKVFNPAFDITDHSLITGIITEYGIAKPPYKRSLKEIFQMKEENRKEEMR